MLDHLQLEHVSCDLCGNPEYRILYRKPDDWLKNCSYEFPVVECHQCGLAYLNPRPTVDSMPLFYPADYHDNRGGEAYVRRYEIQREYVASFLQGKVLDIGCARGDWLHYLERWVAPGDLSGCDLYSKRLSHPYHFISRELPQCGYPADGFDLITAWAVFEHLHSPSAYFAEVGRVLKPGGHFVALVTNAESIYGRYAYKEDIPRHTYFFSPRTLDAYARKSGLCLERVDYETRLWDGSGRGAFYHAGLALAGAKWSDLLVGRIGRMQRIAGRIGVRLDALAFRGNWEAKMKRSGIIVATFAKPG